MTTTATYSFNVPTAGTEEDTWGALLNANWEKADNLLDGTDQVECIRLQRTAMAALALDPDTGNIQTKSISTNSTFTDSFADGDWLLLHLTVSGSPEITWPAITWVPGDTEPVLGNAEHVLAFWKVNTTLYGSYTGATS